VKRFITQIFLVQTLVTLLVVILSVTLTSYLVDRQFHQIPPSLKVAISQLHSQIRDLLLQAHLQTGPDPRRAFRESILLAGLAALVWGIAMALWTSRRLAHPIEEITRAARRIAQGDLSARADLSHTMGETYLLAQTFNQMTEALQRAEEERRHMVADIAHELRTPLAVLQARLDAMEDGVIPLDFQQIRLLSRQTALLTRLVEDLRTLALADAGRLSLKLDWVDLGALIEEVLRGFQPVAEERGVCFLLVRAEVSLIKADADRLAQVLSNLLDNAFKFAPPESEVEVGYAPEDSGIRLWVADQGRGFSPEAQRRALERFYRDRDQEIGGSGLGLAIVKTLIELHGGWVRLANRPRGGAQVELWLPLSGKLPAPTRRPERSGELQDTRRRS
jgi:two-component system sensor histidine kinase BaeS